MSPVLVAVLLVVLVPAAFAAGFVTARRRVVAHAPPRAAPAADVAESPASLASIVRRTGAQLTQIAVQTGVDVGTRVVRDSLGTLSAWAVRERPDLYRVTGADGTVTLMFTDIEGSTAHNERLGDDGWLEVLAVHDKLVRRCIRDGHGQVIKTLGDSFMAAFAKPDAAVDAAVLVQEKVGEMRTPSGAELRVRIGLHTGPAIARGRDLFGINVATASRVAAEARGGEILVTEDVASRLEGDHALGKPRRVALKGISDAPRVLTVRWREGPG
ncbi:MAG TPA: adenylate/guanylate cyclase domain-containing protein [Candidatus Deferrimicrobium sp.]|nr:adenylate/guanylate cyclase domain-containing protein [Candidatus Deferrimicrobium sp.]